MKTSIILTIYLMLAIAGGAGIFYYQSTLPDYESIQNDINEQLLDIESMNSDISELALRSRYNLDSNYDSLTRSSMLLDQAMKNIENEYFADAKRDGSLLERGFLSLKNEIEIKTDLIENFKTHNSVLRNSEKYAPAAGQNLISIAKDAGINEAIPLLSSTVKELLQYSLLTSTESAEKLKTSLPQLEGLKEKMPEFSQVAIVEFINHINTVIKEKEQTDYYLSKSLISTADTKINDLNKHWHDWFEASSNEHASVMQMIIAYISFLLIGLIFISLRLKSLYRNLDHEVAVRTEEIKQTFTKLKTSESKLEQSEELASLGQMVAGVANEINTPLGYITSNVDTVRLNMGELDGILKNVELISSELKLPNADSKKVGVYVRRLVQVYRNMRQRETISEIEALLKDSSYGLSEITNLVSSLNDFSRLERAHAVKKNIHECLDSTLKICGPLIDQRKIVKNYANSLSDVECMPTQLNQVFLNILTNSVQATLPEGIIKITTRQDAQGIEVIFEDNGEGMSDATKHQIFDPFFTTKEASQSSGLGMSISKKIIKSHGGNIVVRSKKGKGTQITISLPLQQSKPELSVIK